LLTSSLAFWISSRLVIIDWHCDFLLEDKFVSKELNPVLEVRHDSVGSSPFALTIETSSEGTLLLLSTGALVRLCLIVESHEKGILAWVIQCGHIWLIQESICNHLTEDILTEMVLISPFKDPSLSMTILCTNTIVNEVLLHQLLELLEHEHPFSINNWQCAEGVQTW
jgi:hypothetical protein